MTKVDQITGEMQKLSSAELSLIRDWLDDVLEDQLEFTADFEAVVARSERERAAGQHTRTHTPSPS